MILSTVRLAIPDRHRHDVFRMLRVFVGHSTAKAGCAGVSVSQDVTDPESVTITERWVTRADFDEHVRSAEYRLLLAAIDLSAAPPEISFDEVDPIGGLDVVTALRSPGVAGHPATPGTHAPEE